jgi:hypothetical protein
LDLQFISSDATVGRLIASVLAQLTLPQVNKVFADFLSDANRARFVALLQSRIGCEALGAFMKKGHSTVFSGADSAEQSSDHAAWIGFRDQVMESLKGKWATLLSTPAPFLAPKAAAAPSATVSKSGSKPNVESQSDFPSLKPAAPKSTAPVAPASDKTPPAPSTWVPNDWPVKSLEDAFQVCGFTRAELPFLAPLDSIWESLATLFAHATPQQLQSVRDEIGESIKSACLLHPAVGFIATLLFPDFVPPQPRAAAPAPMQQRVAPVPPANFGPGRLLMPMMPGMPGPLVAGPFGPMFLTPKGPIPAPPHMLPPHMRPMMAPGMPGNMPPPPPMPGQVFMTPRGPMLMTPQGPVPAPPHLLMQAPSQQQRPVQAESQKQKAPLQSSSQPQQVAPPQTQPQPLSFAMRVAQSSKSGAGESAPARASQPTAPKQPKTANTQAPRAQAVPKK